MPITEPLAFQQRVADLLLSGRNVILQAPTGAGKTYAALLPFLRGQQEGVPFPRKCIYAVPMRVLANQFVDDYREQVPSAKVQTGERPDDPCFRAPVVYATIDQVLSGFLQIPYGLSYRQANVNAGAVLSAYLVMDEFHLYDPVSTLPTALEMLRMLRDVTPFCLMTATFSREMLGGLAQYLDATVVPEDQVSRDAMQLLASQQKERYFHVAEQPLSAQAIVAAHAQQRGRTLVVCNVVERAQELYRDLCGALDGSGTRVLLLHSRFLHDDRKRTEEVIRSVYARDYEGARDVIAVSTQVIEVGLDITCDALHTELAPANAIIQRAGRCARYAAEVGHVYVYAHTETQRHGLVDLVERHMPYQGQDAECAATQDALGQIAGRPATFTDEQMVLSEVHGLRDRSLLQGLIANQRSWRLRMDSVMAGDRTGASADLVRAVASQQVIITDTPDDFLQSPFASEAFGLHLGSAQGLVKRWLERADEADLEDVAISALHTATHEEEDARESAYRWIQVQSPRDALGAAMIAVHPSLATYHPAFGFLPEEGGIFTTTPPMGHAPHGYVPFGYRLEPFFEHVQRVRQALLALWPEIEPAAVRLERRLGCLPGSLRAAAEAVAVLHDVGKLSEGWQGWVYRYQQAIDRPVREGAYAHTDSDPANPAHRAEARRAGARPPHAMESAVAVGPALARLLGRDHTLLAAALSAIARHHAPHASTLHAFRLVHTDLSRVLDGAHGDLSIYRQLPLCPAADPHQVTFDVSTMLAAPEAEGSFLAYLLLVRLLRLADQEATSQVNTASTLPSNVQG